ncbi:MAG: class I SAM-dependent methyltransferase [Candidatus Eisenbacteria bacterium]
MSPKRDSARVRTVSARARAAALPRGYDRASAERYWGDERRRLKDEFRIVLSAGEPPFVNAAYHVWETMSFVRALGPRRGMRVLDLACGLGRVSAPLALSGATVIGVDNARAMVAQAATKTAKAAKSERKKVKAGYAQAFSGALPFADGTFDAVLCLGLLEHLPAWLQERTLAESMRVLKKGGALYLVLNNNRSLLLRAGRDNTYRQARQLDNGYYCGLVDRVTLVSRLARKGAQAEELGSNAHYAVLRHALHGRPMKPAESREAERAFVAATDRDLEEPRQGEFGATCADHFMYRIVRRKKA